MVREKKETPLFTVISALILFLILKTFFLDIKLINGHSMEPTIKSGTFILINKLEYGIIIPIINKYIIRWKKPKVGDIVEARYPYQNKVIIKRCLAREGDEISFTRDYLVINSRNIPWGENYSRENLISGRVPDDKIVIIGDNYYDSIDSRSFGFVSDTDILGRVIKF